MNEMTKMPASVVLLTYYCWYFFIVRSSHNLFSWI